MKGIKRYIQVLAVLCLWGMLVPQPAEARKKVGVVLSGGGAKGAAHIGVLRALEKARIPIDYITGTSMGSIVGGLYAIGYTPDQLDSLIKGQDWSFLLSDKPLRRTQTVTEREKSEKYILSISMQKTTKPDVSGLVQGQNLSSLLTKLTMGYHDSIDYNKLPIPFACVATNVVDGKEIVFHSGVLATSIRASMAIPGFFTPVRKDGMVLIDGGMTNNYPVDVARQMGADIIIGSTVQQDLLKADELNNVTSLLGQLIDISCRKKYAENIAASNIHFQVNTGNYSTMDFTPEAIDTMIHRGEETVYAQWDELMALKKQMQLTASDTANYRHAPLKPLPDSLPIHTVSFDVYNQQEANMIRKACRLNDNSKLSINSIEDALQLLRTEFNYQDAYYTLTDTLGKYNLHFHAQNKHQSSLNLGARFDTEELASLMLNADFSLKTRTPSTVSFTGKLGEQYFAQVQYTLKPRLRKTFSLRYKFHYYDTDVYQKGERNYNVIYRQHFAEMRYSNLSWRNLRLDIGLQFDYYNFQNVLANRPTDEAPIKKSETFFNYIIGISYNSRDKGYFPTRGSNFKAQYALHTDNFVQYEGNTPFSSVSGSWEGTLSPGSNFTVLPAFYGRILIGDNTSYVYSNAIGGRYAGKYITQQLPFAGISHVELTNKALLIACLKLRQRIKRNHYVTLVGNVSASDNEITEIYKGRFVYGGGLEYGYDSKIGPLEASLSYSNNGHKADFYVNLGYYF